MEGVSGPRGEILLEMEMVGGGASPSVFGRMGKEEIVAVSTSMLHFLTRLKSDVPPSMKAGAVGGAFI